MKNIYLSDLLVLQWPYDVSRPCCSWSSGLSYWAYSRWKTLIWPSGWFSSNEINSEKNLSLKKKKPDWWDGKRPQKTSLNTTISTGNLPLLLRTIPSIKLRKKPFRRPHEMLAVKIVFNITIAMQHTNGINNYPWKRATCVSKKKYIRSPLKKIIIIRTVSFSSQSKIRLEIEEILKKDIWPLI